ncbi:uncharacterized protein LOC132309304 [Cornus florida]|uniref:uncharacterized protein LOC132309304 n=1 Tax=Cornus florida TaxID=4283 RepID=UPI00289EC5FE|nr:uncharacterized protein LOC132309304 [Cornus florida]
MSTGGDATTTGPNPTPHIQIYRDSISRHGSHSPNPTQTHQLRTSDYIDFDNEELFNSIIDLTADQHHEHQGSRSSPTSKSFINWLPILKFFCVSSSNSCHGSCSICMDDFEFYSGVNQLPCKHVFHSDCIVPWLRRSNSCPLCRYKLPAEQNPKKLKRYAVSLGDQEGGFHDAMLRNGYVQTRIRSSSSSWSVNGQIGSGLAAAGNSEDSVKPVGAKGE